MAENSASNGPGEGEVPNIRIPPMADFIRRRPRMFIADTGPAGLHRLADELIEYGLADIMSGHGTSIHIGVNADGSLSVTDDGRGIPAQGHAKAEITTLEWVMTFSTWAEVRCGERMFRTSCHGVGTRAVTALSDWAEAEVCHNGRVYWQRYERGLSADDVCDIGPAGGRTGTKITFHPDPAIFPDAAFDQDRLGARLRELAFLNKGLTTKLTDERTGVEETFHYHRGVIELVEHLNRDAEVLHEPISIDYGTGDVKVQIAMQYTAGAEERVRCYGNSAHNRVGGTHQRGFQWALTRTLIRYGHREGLLRGGPAPTSKDFCQGLTAVVSVNAPEPQFEWANKLYLANPEAGRAVASAVRTALAKFLRDDPAAARRIIRKAVAAAETRRGGRPE
jgi:DNA gyrase subunit B